MSEPTQPPSPPSSPPSLPLPLPRPLPVGCRLVPSDEEFVELTEMCIEGVDLKHGVIKEKSAYRYHPAQLIGESGAPAIVVKNLNMFMGSRKKQNVTTYARSVGEMGREVGLWKQAGGRNVIKNKDNIEIGWSCNFDFYELSYPGDKEGKHTSYRLTEYNSLKYAGREKCVYTIVNWEPEYKAMTEALEKTLQMFQSKPKVVEVGMSLAADGKKSKGKGKEEGEMRVSESRFTRSQTRAEAAFFSSIPKKSRSKGELTIEQFYPLFEVAVGKYKEATGRIEAGESSCKDSGEGDVGGFLKVVGGKADDSVVKDAGGGGKENLGDAGDDTSRLVENVGDGGDDLVKNDEEGEKSEQAEASGGVIVISDSDSD